MSLDFAFVSESTHNSTYANSVQTQRSAPSLFEEKYRDYKLYEESRCTDTTGNDIVKATLEKNPISEMFFSKANLDHIQGLIIRLVYKNSDGKWSIGRQSDSELFVIMRSIYLQYGKNLPMDIKGQVAELNRQVLIDAVPRVMTQVEQHLGYMRDQGSTVLPIPRGELATMAGTKTTKGFSSVFI